MTAKMNLDMLHELRNKEGYSISDLAASLGYKTPTGYWLLEKGERKVNVNILYILSKIFDKSMEDFLIVE